jgi:hypothetical protein
MLQANELKGLYSERSELIGSERAESSEQRSRTSKCGKDVRLDRVTRVEGG